MDRTFVSETRRKYFPVGSAPASLLATVSETKAQSMSLERHPFLSIFRLSEFQRFKPGLVGQQCLFPEIFFVLGPENVVRQPT